MPAHGPIIDHSHPERFLARGRHPSAQARVDHKETRYVRFHGADLPADARLVAQLTTDLCAFR